MRVIWIKRQLDETTFECWSKGVMVLSAENFTTQENMSFEMSLWDLLTNEHYRSIAQCDRDILKQVIHNRIEFINRILMHPWQYGSFILEHYNVPPVEEPQKSLQ